MITIFPVSILCICYQFTIFGSIKIQFFCLSPAVAGSILLKYRFTIDSTFNRFSLFHDLFKIFTLFFGGWFFFSRCRNQLVNTVKKSGTVKFCKCFSSLFLEPDYGSDCSGLWISGICSNVDHRYHHAYLTAGIHKGIHQDMEILFSYKFHSRINLP